MNGVSQLRGEKEKGRESECQKPIGDRKHSDLWELSVIQYDYHGVKSCEQRRVSRVQILGGFNIY